MKLMTLVLFGFLNSLSFGSEGFTLIKTEELKSWLNDTKQSVKVYDANSEETRKKDGYIKGATLLTSSKKYDAKTVLPTDKNSKVVFYCYNEKCMASHRAAKVAVNAGYKSVYVLSDGIFGWKQKGGDIEVLK